MTMTRRRFLTISAATVACAGLPEYAQASMWQWNSRAFGSDVSISIVAASEAKFRRVVRGIEREIGMIEETFSLFADSETAHLNRTGNLRNPGKRILEVFDLVTKIHEASGGVFDPTVQSIWNAYAKGLSADLSRTRGNWQQVRWSPDEIRLDGGMELTFNGIAQGYAADRIAALLRREGYETVLVNMGEISAIGSPPGRTSWQAGIADPSGRILGHANLGNRSLATSSPTGMLIGAQGIHHIIHPAGRKPVWNTVSVSASSAAVADGLSTAFCLMDSADIESALLQFPDARLELCV